MSTSGYVRYDYLHPITQYFWLSVLHMGQRQKIQLITQDLICSSGVNMSQSQLLISHPSCSC